MDPEIIIIVGISFICAGIFDFVYSKYEKGVEGHT